MLSPSHRSIHSTGLAGFVLVWLICVAGTSYAQTTFVDEGVQRGIGSYEVLKYGFGSGVAAADYDDDGDVDFFLPAGKGTPYQLYRNDGTGHFEEIAAQAGLALSDGARVALWIDVDGDNRMDLVVAGDCYLTTCDQATYIRLFRQHDDGTFQDVTGTSGLSNDITTPAAHRGGMAAADVNGDGYLDLVAGVWVGPLHLFLNKGDGTFVDSSAASGIDDTVLHYHQPVLLDLNADGLIDIFSAVDFTENRLWQNQGTVDGIPHFVEVASSAGCDNAMNDMGVAVGDYDDDGDPDLYVTNIRRDDRHNILMRQDSASPLEFSDVSQPAAVDSGGWGWGTTFIDMDNDGYLDLAETNGWGTSTWDDSPRLFEHQHDDPPTFVDRAATSGLTEISWGSSIVSFDADRDGDLDLLQVVIGRNKEPSYVSLYANQLDRGSGDRRYLVIRPRMSGPNTRAIGARVTIRSGDRTLTRWVLAGSSYLGQEPAEAFFGLGSATTADEVSITWPDGSRTTLVDVGTGQVLTVRKPARRRPVRP